MYRHLVFFCYDHIKHCPSALFITAVCVQTSKQQYRTTTSKYTLTISPQSEKPVTATMSGTHFRDDTRKCSSLYIQVHLFTMCRCFFFFIFLFDFDCPSLFYGALEMENIKNTATLIKNKPNFDAVYIPHKHQIKL